jgi:hypothetical protein
LSRDVAACHIFIHASACASGNCVSQPQPHAATVRGCRRLVALGTATAVFAIVNSVVLRPLPFQHAERLVAIWGVNPSRDTVKRGCSWPDTIDLSRATRSLDGVAAMANAPSGMTLTG